MHNICTEYSSSRYVLYGHMHLLRDLRFSQWRKFKSWCSVSWRRVVMW